MTGPLEQVATVFKAHHWEFDYQEDGEILGTNIEGANGEWQVLVTDVNDGGAFVMLSVFPQKCLPHLRRACAELVTRASFGLTNGYFEMDVDTGRVFFKTVLPFLNGSADPDQLERAILANLATMDSFIPAGMSVIYADKSPQQAMTAVLRRQKAAAKSMKRPGKASGRGRHRRFINN